MSASTPRPKLEKDRAVPIFRDLFGNDNLREVELVEKLDEKRQFVFSFLIYWVVDAK